uniref:Uncharacterized protein n=1 Tax=Anguilla anguilla TaxID=7936 RepID=A0A0E9V9I3_ANGAN
MFSPYDIS